MNGLIETFDSRGIATLTLDRPARHNALDQALIEQLTESIQRLDARTDIRVVVLAGNGSTFCAGADIASMKRMAAASSSENEDDARRLAKMLETLDTLSKPTLALVHGAVYGGGVGVVACCDIVIATDNAQFCLSEARLGLIPAIVGPFVLRAMGVRHARRFILTSEEISASEAVEIGLVHRVMTEDEFPGARDKLIDALLAGAPGAQAEAKALMAVYARRPIDQDLLALSARALARRRASAEAREGLTAFLEKRLPCWHRSGA